MIDGILYEVTSMPGCSRYGISCRRAGKIIYECQDISTSAQTLANLADKLNRNDVPLEIAMEVFEDFVAELSFRNAVV